MKLATISALIAVGSCLGAGIASAATCGPDANLGPISSTAQVSGNSCTHNANFNGSTFCGGVAFSNTGTDVWAVPLGASQSFTFTVTASGATPFTPVVGLLATCADNGNCVTEAEAPAATPTTVTTGTISGNAASTYFIVVTDSTGVGPQCGAYNLSFSGTLPVKLENFSVD